MQQTSNVIIVGAGVIGCFIAYELAKEGYGVTVVEKMRFLKAYVGDRPLPGIDFKAFARKILAVGQQVLKRDIRRAAKNALKKSSKIGPLSHRGTHCYYRKSYLKQKKYSDDDIREIIDEIIMYHQ